MYSECDVQTLPMFYGKRSNVIVLRNVTQFVWSYVTSNSYDFCTSFQPCITPEVGKLNGLYVTET